MQAARRPLPLPRGHSLDEARWRRRHDAIVVLLAGHAAGVIAFGLATGHDVDHVALVTAPLALSAYGAHALVGSRDVATVVATLGLLTSSTVILHLSGGAVEAGFHVFVVLGVIALYQEWLPFALAVTYLIVLHGVGVALFPGLVPGAAGDPWVSAAVHAVFVLAMATVNLISWRLAETSASAADEMAHRNQLLLDAVGEGVFGVDADGRATFVNPAAARMLGWEPDELIGRDIHETAHHSRSDGTLLPAGDCLVRRAVRDGATQRSVDEVLWRRDGSWFPVDMVARPLFEGGEVVGAVVTFDDATSRRMADEARRELSRLTELEHAQREVLHRLQETVRPPKPVVAHTELGVHYLPAEAGAPAGGDLYDWQVMPDGDLYVAVIDVAGKGVTATKEALSVAHALRLSALAGRDLGELVVNAGALLTAQDPDLVATVVVARYDPATGVVRMAGASHPPAIHLTAAGEAREVHAPGLAIGWPGAGSFEVVEVRLERGDALILFTDGLVEAGKDLASGLEEARRQAADLTRYPADLLARALVDRMLASGTRRDDTLALVVRRRTPPAAAGRPLGPFAHRLRANEAVVPLARRLFADWLAHQPLEPGEVEDLPLVVSELCTNAVRAARTSVELRAWADGTDLVIEVEDDGDGLAGWVASGELEPRVPDLHQERGRGLFLAEALTDDLAVDAAPGRTTVRCLKRAVLGAAGA